MSLLPRGARCAPDAMHAKPAASSERIASKLGVPTINAQVAAHEKYQSARTLMMRRRLFFHRPRGLTFP